MEFLRNLANKKILYISIGGLAALLLIIGGALVMQSPQMVPLYASLSVEDNEKVVTRLQSMNIQYVVESGESKRIMVPMEKSLQIRMMLAQEGIPSSGSIVGYEIFDKSDLLTSSTFLSNVNLVRALEGELARTISSLASVQTARVHLVLPKNEIFSRGNSLSPSASVMIRLKNGKQLADEEITGITNLIAMAVPGLDVDRVMMIDQYGKSLKSKRKTEKDDNDLLTYRQNIEEKLENNIEDILGRHIGFGKVKASVSVMVNPNKEVLNIEEYDPDGQVVRSTKSMDEEERDGIENNNVSIATNLPNFEQRISDTQGKTKKRSDSITNYEISKTVTNKVIQWGEITRISAAVLVDGYYSEDPTTKGSVYQERPAEELLKLRSLVAAAIGFNKERGDHIELVNLKFADDGGNDLPVKNEDDFRYDNLAIIVLFGSMLLITAGVWWYRSRRYRHGNIDHQAGLLEESNKDGQYLNQENSANGAEAIHEDTNIRPEERYLRLIESVNDFVAQNPEAAAKILRDWLMH